MRLFGFRHELCLIIIIWLHIMNGFVRVKSVWCSVLWEHNRNSATEFILKGVCEASYVYYALWEQVDVWRTAVVEVYRTWAWRCWGCCFEWDQNLETAGIIIKDGERMPLFSHHLRAADVWTLACRQWGNYRKEEEANGTTGPVLNSHDQIQSTSQGAGRVCGGLSSGFQTSHNLIYPHLCHVERCRQLDGYADRTHDFMWSSFAARVTARNMADE